MIKTIDVDTKTFVRFWLVILGFILAAIVIWKALNALIIISIALFLTIAIRPLAHKINRLTVKDHAASSTVIAYVLLISVLGLIISLVGPVVIEQTTQFVRQFPTTFEHTLGGWEGVNQIGHTFGIENLKDEAIKSVQDFSSQFIRNFGNFLMMGVGTTAQVLTNIILVIVLTLFFSLEGPTVMESFWKMVEGKKRSNSIRATRHLIDRMVGVISTYISRQVMVAVLDGCVVTIVVLLLAFVFGISGNLALPMGLLAMVFYLIPMFGPIISCGLITLILLFSSPVAAIIFLVFYIIYAQIENNIIAPKIQGSALNLPATIVLVSIVIGMNLFGLLGTIIAIPIAGCIRVLIEEIPNLRKAHVLPD